MEEEKRQATRDRIGQRIAQLREQAGLTQEQLAEKAGLKPSNVARIEAGCYAAPVEVVQAIAEALGKTVDIIDPECGKIEGYLGKVLERKVTDVFQVKPSKLRDALHDDKPS